MSVTPTADPRQIRLSREPDGSVSAAIAGGRAHRGIAVIRAAPLSEPKHFVSLLDADGQEIAMIKDPSELDAETRRILENELDRRYMSVSIRRIRSARNDGGVWHLDVEVDGGRHELILQHAAESIRRVAGHGLLLRDCDGHRFEITDIRTLDQRSRRLLDTVI